ncbi:MAG: acyloxyacyl hydrolase [Muribaculaceae bacterium]|nr:acyloxyacyl hydrolase [Muribaculaceae bacterium]
MKRQTLLVAVTCILAFTLSAADSIPGGFSLPLRWRAGVEMSSGWVPGTSSFMRGENPSGSCINSTLSGDARVGFSYDQASLPGMLYKGLYQGLGIGVNSYFHEKTLGTPVSVYVFQGAPFAKIGRCLWLGYEWEFGAAFGWKHYNEQSTENTAPVSTSVTAHMGIAAKFHYHVSDRWKLSAGVNLRHYSNGNTSFPNRGVNSVGAVVGVEYNFNLEHNDCPNPSNKMIDEADKGKWVFDVMAFGACRKRVLVIDNSPAILPGKFGVFGMQFSPLRQLNRYVAVGPAIDFMWDESADLTPNWVEGSYGENILFRRPKFGDQISVGASAHAELTMPVFTLNAGLGYDFVKPSKERRFYQSLTLKTFITQNIYLNVGYRLARFHDPQNLMLGLGVRL